MSNAKFRKLKCTLCDFIYDEEQGWPEEGIPPFTKWEDVPEDWSCPDCAAAKNSFNMIEIGEVTCV